LHKTIHEVLQQQAIAQIAVHLIYIASKPYSSGNFPLQKAKNAPLRVFVPSKKGINVLDGDCAFKNGT
jgi:hypothetical protein